MPELPEVEVLVRHLEPLVRGQSIKQVLVNRPKVLAPTPEGLFCETLRGARFTTLTRRGKYLVFSLMRPGTKSPLVMLGHLGMTGRMYLANTRAPLPRHCPVVLELGNQRFVFEDTRYFGRLTLDLSPLEALGPEPLSDAFHPQYLATNLKRSRQPIKVKLLDQSLVAGVGNIYASEALFRARISPRLSAHMLTFAQTERLYRSIREVLLEAIQGGSTVALNFSGNGKTDGLFYFGSAPGTSASYEERLLVYDRAGKPCFRCQASIRRLQQAGRSSYFCPVCQGKASPRSKLLKQPRKRKQTN